MVGSGDEDYLRYLQIAGLASLYPWSIREFSQPELEQNGNFYYTGITDPRANDVQNGLTLVRMC